MLVKFLKHFKAFIIMLMLLSVIIGLYSFKTFPKEASPAINVPFFTINGESKLLVNKLPVPKPWYIFVFKL